METRVGQNALGILLVQDVLIVPMMIILGYMSGEPVNPQDVVLQLVGAVLIISFCDMALSQKRNQITLPQAIKA